MKNMRFVRGVFGPVLMVIWIVGGSYGQVFVDDGTGESRRRMEAVPGVSFGGSGLAAAITDPKERFERAAASAGEGKNLILHLACNGQRFSRMTSAVCYGYSAVNTRDLLYIDIMREKPRYAGVPDGTIPPEYFNAEVGHGEVKGLHLGMAAHIFTSQFGAGDNHGLYRYTIYVSNSDGLRLQKIIFEAYLGDYGPYEPRFQLNEARPGTASYIMTGKFPVNRPLYVRVGSHRGPALFHLPMPQFMPRSEKPGTVLNSPGRIRFSKTTWLDVSIWDAETGISLSLPNAVIEPGLDNPQRPRDP
ncbi:MAG: hypothetical protein H7070_10700 [Saprospiraceae bacterium]|nr:hypothetical protein [Pyrinomonadaceae bacterium]